jgi:aminocarboxymuconate-semialdehyde decarboxylase
MSGVIEVHAHVLPKEIMGQAGPYGPSLEPKEGGGFRIQAGAAVLNASTVAHKKFAEGAEGGEDPSVWFDRLSNPERRLAEMSQTGVDAMVVSPAPPLYMYGIEAEYAVPFARAYNDALAKFCTAASDRLYFMATLPMQDLAASIVETRRAVQDLDARGVYIGATELGGRELDDPDMWPLYEALVTAGLPLAIHPGPSTFGSGDVDCYHERLVLGFPAQETHAIFRLIAGGVFDAFPDLRVYVSHGGGFFPFQVGRFDAFLSISGDSKASRPAIEYTKNLYLDIILHDARARQLLVDVMGPDHVLYGSNYAGMDSVDGISFLNQLELSDNDRLQIARQNALDLFKLGR